MKFFSLTYNSSSSRSSRSLVISFFLQKTQSDDDLWPASCSCSFERTICCCPAPRWTDARRTLTRTRVKSSTADFFGPERRDVSLMTRARSEEECWPTRMSCVSHLRNMSSTFQRLCLCLQGPGKVLFLSLLRVCVCDCLFVEKNLERMPEKLFRSGFVMDMGVFCALCVGVCRGGNYYIQ